MMKEDVLSGINNPLMLLPCQLTVCTVQVDYPEIADGIRPRHRFMSAFEQRMETPDRQWQYLMFAAEPYETIAFKVRLS